ncbi:M16 family metallopeptidase [Croceiramulus getboli]|nr:insulinase family protein [Flavobacteriaceae bacterium YJPT1-3]
MNKRKMFMLLFVGFLGFLGTAQDISKSTPIQEQKIPVDPEVKIGTLSNGLTYYIRNNGKPEDKVELRLVVNAGSIMENEDQQGLAHFMEHMNFNGTKNFEKNDLVDYLQSIGVKFGADLNAYTSFDETVYILPIPSDDPEKLEKGFQILEDWAHNTTLTEEAIDGERGVVLEEYRLGLGPDKRMMQEYLPKLMYNSQYAERLPIGTKENLETFSYDALRNYYKTWYRPDLMAVIAVGDLDVETLEKKIKSHFSSINKAKNPEERKSYPLPNHEETLIAIAADPEAAFSQVQIAYKDRNEAPTVETVVDYKEQLAKQLFSTMINNRLNERRNAANPPFVFGFSYYGGTYARSKNAYQSIANTSEDGQLTGLKALLEENERVKRYGFRESEFKRAKQEILARLERAYNDRDKQESGRLIGQYVQHYLDDEPIPSVAWEYETTQALLPSIALTEVNDLINNFLHDDNRVIILTGPKKDGLELVKEEEVLALLQEVQQMEIAGYEDEALRANLIEQAPVPGSITSESTDDELGMTTLTLSNGAKVVYKKTDFKNDEIVFQASSKGGWSLYTPEEYEQTVFANGGLAEAGIAGLSTTDLSKMMSGKIVSVRPSIGRLSEGLSGQAAPKDLQTLFEMIHLYFTNLNKDEEAYGSFIAKQKSFLGNLMANPQFYFQDQLGKIRNEGNPYYTGFPTPEKMDAQNYELAFAKYQERFANAGDFTFYFVGNIDEAQLKELAKNYLASLPASEDREDFVPTEFRGKDEYQKTVVRKGTDPKSLVQIIWEEETTYDPKEALAIDALGEVLSIKLIEKLREEEGGVYGVGARGTLSKISFSNVTFSISFPCGPENVDKLVEAALQEVAKIKQDGPTAKDVQKVKETYTVERKENLQKNAFWLQEMVQADLEDRDLSRILNYDQAVSDLTGADIQDVAKKYLDDNYFLGILMPEEGE